MVMIIAVLFVSATWMSMVYKTVDFMFSNQFESHPFINDFLTLKIATIILIVYFFIGLVAFVLDLNLTLFHFWLIYNKMTTYDLICLRSDRKEKLLAEKLAQRKAKQELGIKKFQVR